MTIEIGGNSFSQAEVIAAIQQSNDAAHQEALASLQATIEDREATVAQLTEQVATLEGAYDGDPHLLQAILTRLNALEQSLPLTRAGFGVTTTTQGNVTTYRVQVTDQNGQPMIVVFELPSNASA